MKALLVLFSVLLILLLIGLWVGSGSYPDRWRLENIINEQKQANALQKDKNRRIQAELDDVASGNDAIEERARSELGMTKKGETFFEVILKPSEESQEPLPAPENGTFPDKANVQDKLSGNHAETEHEGGPVADDTSKPFNNNAHDINNADLNSHDNENND